MTHSSRMHTRRAVAGCLFIWILLAGFQTFAGRADNAIHLSQYRHRVWRASEGWFDSSILAIAQGADGYLWIGTELSLLRFDGVRFSTWSAPRGHKPLKHVKWLLASRDGAMWIVSSQGLSVFKGQELTDVPLTGASIQALYEDHAGTVWAVRAKLKIGQLPLCSVSTQPVKCYGPADGLTVPYATRMTQDPDGYFWIGSGLLARWKPGTSQTAYFGDALKAFGNSNGVADLLTLADGSLLAGLGAPGDNAGLQRLQEGQWRSYSVPPFDGRTSGGNVLFQDREGAIWLSPYDGGLVHLQNGAADTFTRGDGLSGDDVRGIIQDAEGSVWVATDRGLDNFSRPAVTAYTVREGMPMRGASSVLARPDGSLLVLGEQLFSLKDGAASLIPGLEHFKRESDIYSALLDSAGNLWFGGNRLYRYRDGKLVVVKTASGADRLEFGEIVPALAEDSRHTVWGLVTGRNHHRRLVRILADQIQDVSDLPSADLSYFLAADRAGGLWMAGGSNRLSHFKEGQITTQEFANPTGSFSANDLFVDSADSVWVASNQGMRIVREGVTHSITTDNGLPCDSINSAFMDRDQTVWLAAACGLLRLDRKEWRKALDVPNSKLTVQLFGPSAGYALGYIDAAARVAQTTDGKLWFAGPDLQMIDPRALPSQAMTPPVHIERLVVDRQPYEVDTLGRISPNPRELEIDYTAPAFTEPSSVRFKYRLEGHDESWQVAGTRRQAFYNDLSPGHYRFQVMAGEEGTDSKQQEDALEFTILPAFYQTWWFRALCVLLLAIALWFIYVIRLRHVTGLLRLRHQERLMERESIARDLHDTFFQEVHGLLLRVHVASHLPEPASMKETLNRVLDDSDRVMLQGRQVMLDLRAETSKTMTLEEAFSNAASALQTAYPCDFQVILLGDPRPLLPLVFEETRRFGQEALSNAFRHAKATAIKVEIHYAGQEFALRILDDGVGIDPKVLNSGSRDGHWGLPGMRERAAKIGGHLGIRSRQGSGTDIELRLPSGTAYASRSRRLNFLR